MDRASSRVRWRARAIAIAVALLASSGPAIAWEPGPSPAPMSPAAERGRIALTQTSLLPPAWSPDAFAKAGSAWPSVPPTDPAEYAAAFNARYGLHPAPYPNDGLPMGLRRAESSKSGRKGIMIDCMACHGGSIGGTSYVGLGNTQLDLSALLVELNKADGKRPPIFTFTLNTVRGSVNAGQVSAALLQLRNRDLSFRTFPLPLGADLPEMDVPAWWLLKKKRTMYIDGRTDARSVRTNMQFTLGDLTLDELKKLEPTFRDIREYFLSLEPPKYPFPIDSAKAEAGRAVFEKACSKCHGTYGPDGSYPNVVVGLDRIGTDPVRARGLSKGLVAHYNGTWLGEEHPADEDPEVVGYQAPPLDGIWATAPYLHNGSVPTVRALLKSDERPGRFRRPSSTGFEHYDRDRLGWKAEAVEESPPLHDPASKWIYDTSRRGLGNGGHTFGDSLSEADRMTIIEYLKTL